MLPLPQSFVDSMRNQLGEQTELLIEALNTESPVSVRINPQKWHGADFGTPVPWCEWGRYLDVRPQFTLDIPFSAGGYYVQEAGSQFIAHILKTEGVEGGKILDMCAAPGGKSIQLAQKLQNAIIVTRQIQLQTQVLQRVMAIRQRYLPTLRQKDGIKRRLSACPATVL